MADRGPLRRVLSVGRLVPRKGFDTVIRALAAVPDTELVIAGGPAAGDLADDPEAVRLRRLAERLGVADRVRLVGAVPRPDMPALLRSADLVVCAPWYEPFGMVPLEAMACGVPVVASAVGGFLDTVVDGATGILVPPQRPDRLAAAMRKLLAEPFWREAFGTAGVDRARSRYSWDRIAAGTVEVYERALEVAGVAGARAGSGGGDRGVTGRTAPRPLVVVGDALLDRDVTGRADRLSPDAPVPVVSAVTGRRSGPAGRRWPRCWPRWTGRPAGWCWSPRWAPTRPGSGWRSCWPPPG